MKQRIQVSVQFDTYAQKDRVRKAAKTRKWSMSKFLIDAGEKEAEKILTSIQSSEQLTVAPEQPSLNQ